jgi:hypothetical protein
MFATNNKKGACGGGAHLHCQSIIYVRCCTILADCICCCRATMADFSHLQQVSTQMRTAQPEKMSVKEKQWRKVGGINASLQQLAFGGFVEEDQLV